MRLHRKHNISVFVAAIAAFALAACAQLPSDAKVKAFGDATTSVSDALNKVIDVNAELALRTGEEYGARPYIEYTANEKSAFKFPPEKAPGIRSKVLIPPRQLIAAVGGYAKALAAAADKGTIKDLEAAAVTLSSTVGAVAAPLAGPAVVPLITPAAKLVGRGIGLAIANQYALEIRNVMQETHPYLVKSAAILKNVIGHVYQNSKTLYGLWASQKKNVLIRLRNDSTVNRSVSYDNYRAAAAMAYAIQAKLDALSTYSRVLDAMVNAHASLISDQPDSSEAFSRFIELAKELDDFLLATKEAKP